MIHYEEHENPQPEQNINLHHFLGLYFAIDKGNAGLIVGCKGKFIRVGWLYLDIGKYDFLDEYWRDRI